MVQRSFWGAARLLTATIMWASLASCGGSGGSADPVTPPPVVAAPVITQQPASQTVQEGSAVTFSVSVQSNATVTYQWLRNGVEVASANSSSHLIPAAVLADSGSRWSVRAANSGGSVTSGEAVLTVNAGVPAVPLGTSLYLGDSGVTGATDGVGREARFNGVTGLAIDAAGNTYVADSGNNAVRKITPAGAVSTPHSSLCSYNAAGVAVGGDGVVYMLMGSSQLAAADICRYDPATGAVTKVVESREVGYPLFLARGTGNSLVIASYGGLYRYTPGSGVSTLVGAGNLSEITGMATDAAGNVYVAVTGGDVHRYSPTGGLSLVAARARFAAADDGPIPAEYFFPGIAVDAAGNVFVVHAGTQAKPGSNIFRIAPSGEVTKAYLGAIPLRLGRTGLAFDAAGDLYYGAGAGVGKAARGSMDVPRSGSIVAGRGLPVSEKPVGVDGGGNMTTVEMVGAQPVIRRYGPAGQQLPVGANGQGLSLAPLTGTGLVRYAVDLQGNLYVAYTRAFSSANLQPASAEVYKVSPTGQTSQVLLSQDGQPGFVAPTALALDAQGNLYMADAVTSSIRKRSADGAVTAVTAPGSVPGATIRAAVTQLAVTGAGTVHLVDESSILRVAGDGTITRIAGAPPNTAAAGRGDGTGLDARFVRPLFPVADASGQVYVGDQNVLRRITPAGVVTTLPDIFDASVDGMVIDAAGMLYPSAAGGIKRVRLQ